MKEKPTTSEKDKSEKKESENTHNLEATSGNKIKIDLDKLEKYYKSVTRRRVISGLAAGAGLYAGIKAAKILNTQTSDKKELIASIQQEIENKPWSADLNSNIEFYKREEIKVLKAVERRIMQIGQIEYKGKTFDSFSDYAQAIYLDQMLMGSSVIPYSVREKLALIIPGLFYRESRYRKDAFNSRSKAKGIAQITPSGADQIKNALLSRGVKTTAEEVYSLVGEDIKRDARYSFYHIEQAYKFYFKNPKNAKLISHIFSSFNITSQEEKDIFTALLLVNQYNAGIGKMLQALEAISEFSLDELKQIGYQPGSGASLFNTVMLIAKKAVRGYGHEAYEYVPRVLAGAELLSDIDFAQQFASDPGVIKKLQTGAYDLLDDILQKTKNAAIQSMSGIIGATGGYTLAHILVKLAQKDMAYLDDLLRDFKHRKTIISALVSASFLGLADYLYNALPGSEDKKERIISKVKKISKKAKQMHDAAKKPWRQSKELSKIRKEIKIKRSKHEIEGKNIGGLTYDTQKVISALEAISAKPLDNTHEDLAETLAKLRRHYRANFGKRGIRAMLKRAKEKGKIDIARNEAYIQQMHEKGLLAKVEEFTPRYRARSVGMGNISTMLNNEKYLYLYPKLKQLLEQITKTVSENVEEKLKQKGMQGWKVRVIANSFIRTLNLNSALPGSSKLSPHLAGLAIDFSDARVDLYNPELGIATEINLNKVSPSSVRASVAREVQLQLAKIFEKLHREGVITLTYHGRHHHITYHLD